MTDETIVRLPSGLARELCALGIAHAVDDDTAAFLSGGLPIELNEQDMAAVLDISPSALQKRRERLACEGLYRRSGKEIIYSVPLTLRAFRVKIPDILE